MNICFATDKGYIMPLTVALLSLLENNKDSKFDIYILHNSIEEVFLQELFQMCKSHGSNLNSIVISDKDLEGFPTNDHISKASYYRLLMDKFLPENMDKILYLDADIVVNGSVKELYNHDLQENVLGAIENPNFSRHESLGMDKSARYFNAGILLINLERWKAENICEKTLDYINNNKEKLVCHDQCAINAVINGKWSALSPKYNLQTSYFSKNKSHGYTKEEVLESTNNPVIIHYTGSSKPWSFGDKHPYKKLFLQYLRKTSYKNYKYKDVNLKNFIKRLIPNFLRG